MHRRGEKAEKWIAENLCGSATVNSGAKFKDGDWRTRWRLYEVKEREIDNSIVVRGNAVNQHIDRAKREILGCAFMVMTRNNWVYFIVPAEDFLMTAQNSAFLMEMYQASPGMLSSRGSNIKVREELVATFRKENIFLWKYARKNRDVWVIIEGQHWLEICGEKKLV